MTDNKNEKTSDFLRKNKEKQNQKMKDWLKGPEYQKMIEETVKEVRCK